MQRACASRCGWSPPPPHARVVGGHDRAAQPVRAVRHQVLLWPAVRLPQAMDHGQVGPGDEDRRALVADRREELLQGRDPPRQPLLAVVLLMVLIVGQAERPSSTEPAGHREATHPGPAISVALESPSA
jgi:hypothetical protein